MEARRACSGHATRYSRSERCKGYERIVRTFPCIIRRMVNVTEGPSNCFGGSAKVTVVAMFVQNDAGFSIR